MSGKDVIDVQRFLNEHPFSRLQWLIFALCFVIVVLDGFDTAAVGFIAPSLIAEWHVEKSSSGAGVERGAFRAGVRRHRFRTAVGPLGPARFADRFGRAVRPGVAGVRAGG